MKNHSKSSTVETPSCSRNNLSKKPLFLPDNPNRKKVYRECKKVYLIYGRCTRATFRTMFPRFYSQLTSQYDSLTISEALDYFQWNLVRKDLEAEARWQAEEDEVFREIFVKQFIKYGHLPDREFDPEGTFLEDNVRNGSISLADLLNHGYAPCEYGCSNPYDGEFLGGII